MFPGELNQSELLRGLSEGVKEEEDTRKRLGKVDIVGSISEVGNSVKVNLFAIIQDERSRLKSYVTVFQTIAPQTDSELTSALFSAYYLDTKSRVLKQMAKDLISKGRIKPAAAILDMKYGYEMALIAVGIIELLKSHNSLSGYAVLDWEINKLKESAEKGPALDDVVVRPWQNPELVIAGAEVAQELYKEFYPRAAGILNTYKPRKKKR